MSSNGRPLEKQDRAEIFELCVEVRSMLLDAKACLALLRGSALAWGVLCPVNAILYASPTQCYTTNPTDTSIFPLSRDSILTKHRYPLEQPSPAHRITLRLEKSHLENLHLCLARDGYPFHDDGALE